MRWLFYVLELDRVKERERVCVLLPRCPGFPGTVQSQASPRLRGDFPLLGLGAASSIGGCLDLASGFWQTSAMSFSGWLTATRSMMLLHGITLCLLAWLFIYLDSWFPPDGPWCTRRLLLGLRRYFFWDSFHLKSIAEPSQDLGLWSLLQLISPEPA